MNPLTKWLEISAEVFVEIYERMPKSWRRYIAADCDHQTELFADFDYAVKKETQRRYDSWLNTDEGKFEPETSNRWLFGV